MDFGLSLDLGIIVAIAALFIELRRQHKSDREGAERDRQRSQFEIYQRLELASVELYRFEADHLDLIRPLYTGKNSPTEVAERHAYKNYVAQILNLFELQIELYSNSLVDQHILETWVPWFNQLGRAPGFPEVWGDGLGANYSARLQRVMVRIIEANRDLEAPELLATVKAGSA